MKKVLAITLLIPNILFLWINGLLWLYALSADFKITIIYEIFVKYNVYIIRDFVMERCIIWILCAFIVFIIDLKCFKFIKNKLIIILSIVNILLSSISIFLWGAF